MTHRFAAVAVALLLLAAVVADGAAPGAEHPRYRQILATRPAPRLEDLAARAAPDVSGDAAVESFWDLLKLRDAPQLAADPAAVTALVKVVEAHAGSSRIHRFAAGQALLAADTPDALRALARDASRAEFPANLAVMYASHWEMSEPARSTLLERYVLKSAGDGGLGVAVAAAWQPRPGARTLAVTLTLTNRTGKPLALLLDADAAARGLFFRSPAGTIVAAAARPPGEPMPPRWIRLAAGASERVAVELTPTRDPAALARFAGTAPPPAIVLSEGGGGGGGGATYGLGGVGRYRLYAMIVQPPMTAEQVATLRQWANGAAAKDAGDPSELWAGRAVSDPADVEIGEAAAAAPPAPR
jgi:hypothetical protein